MILVVLYSKIWNIQGGKLLSKMTVNLAYCIAVKDHQAEMKGTEVTLASNENLSIF